MFEYHTDERNEMDKENKVAFCIGDTDDGPCLIFGITPSAWEHMKDGDTHQFDLTIQNSWDQAAERVMVSQ